MNNAVVQTASGKIEGIIENKLYVFKAIPYAAPPLGLLRWGPPQPHPVWEGIRPAMEFGKISLQPAMPGPRPLGIDPPEEMDEDCLFLNIWTPGLDDHKRPVMVWIHGGAFVMGSGSQLRFGSGKLPRNFDVVTVSINYRLGILGFLNLNVATEGKIPASGNEGLLDQVAALQWVKDNISAFGGDPDNVTVFGESAGSMSIGCLIVMPAARGLFQKAIMQSGTGSMARALEPSISVARQFLNLAERNGANAAQIIAMPPERLLRIQTDMTLKTGRMTPVAPVIDGKILPMPLEALKAGAGAGIKTLVGTNLDEFKLFELMAPPHPEITDETLPGALEHMVATQKLPQLISAYRRALTQRSGPPKAAAIYSAVNTDIMFRMPSVRFLEARCQNNQDAYAYLFTWQSPAMNGALGACHALEIGFVFGEMDSDFCGSGPDADKLSWEIQEAWTTFARTGNPSTPSLGPWPSYCQKRETMILGKISHVEEAPYDDERAIWNEIGGV